MAAITGIDRRVLGRWFNPVKAAQILGSTFFILDN
jgi:hypothetical protein